MNNTITWVGLDAHKAFIQVAVLPPGKAAPVEWRIEHTKAKVKKLAKRLVTLAGNQEVRACYEAGPCGWALKRALEDAAPVICEVVAPTLIPVKPGDRVKTDRRDALKLANYLKAGLLTRVAPPTETQETVRDIVRQRDAAVQDLTRARHRLSKFLIRRHISFTGKSRWGIAHQKWLATLSFDNPIDTAVFDDLYGEVVHQSERKTRLTGLLEEVASRSPYAEPVGWLRCYRGIDTVTAMILLSELFDFERFQTARQLMSYLGLTPSEYTSGAPNRGSITKAGNGRVRKVLVESAQHARKPPRVSQSLLRRRVNQPGQVVASADRAMRRLNRVYWRLTERGKHHNVAVIAVARELVGFIWATLHPTAGIMAKTANQ